MQLSDVSTNFLVAGLIALVAAIVAQVILARTFRLIRGQRKSRAEAIGALLSDIGEAQHSILVACDECSASGSDEQKILSALKAAKDRTKGALKVEFVWGPAQEPPQFVRDMEKAGTIEVFRARGPLPFTGRVIDDRKVEIHRSGSDLVPKNFLRTERAAPGVAERLTDLVHAA